MPNPRPDDKKGSRFNHWYGQSQSRLPRYMRCEACGTVLCVRTKYTDFDINVMGRHASDCYPLHRDQWRGFVSAESRSVNQSI